MSPVGQGDDPSQSLQLSAQAMDLSGIRCRDRALRIHRFNVSGNSEWHEEESTGIRGWQVIVYTREDSQDDLPERDWSTTWVHKERVEIPRLNCFVCMRRSWGMSTPRQKDQKLDWEAVPRIQDPSSVIRREGRNVHSRTLVQKTWTKEPVNPNR